MAKAGVVGVETRLFRGEMSEARWRFERRVVRKAGDCQWCGQLRTERLGRLRCGARNKADMQTDILELDRKPGMLSPKAFTFSKSQSDRISISETLIVGKCS